VEEGERIVLAIFAFLREKSISKMKSVLYETSGLGVRKDLDEAGLE
jgi:hypothetical protein